MGSDVPAGTAVLSAGDFLYVPLNARLKLELYGRSIDITGLATESVDGIRGHLIAVTGPSIRRVLSIIKPDGPHAIDTSQFLLRVKAGEYESRAVTEEDWDRIIGYGVRPGSERTPTLEEVHDLDYESLHRGLGERFDD